ncbi:hypothetical protein JOF53_002886 [Crossiella equi]|uniref:Uncharacterized protein n=1 Tax=Crossiella equi TaxID=130796 RepID=A0ABS5ABQ9_9PSEU|nr:hypothetical protein [Crossiella equi]MBP2474014.1 hypothetical protein [Crossiella equi]
MTPEQIAEATRLAVAMHRWESTDTRWDCECTLPCLHGTRCEACPDGKLRHLFRLPGAMLSFRAWLNIYLCDDEDCDEGEQHQLVEYPDRPWGYLNANKAIAVFHGVVHPQFRSTWGDAEVIESGEDEDGDTGEEITCGGTELYPDGVECGGCSDCEREDWAR